MIGILAAAKNRQGSGDSVVVLVVRGWLRARALMVVLKVVLWVELWFVWSLWSLARLVFRARALWLVGGLLAVSLSDG